MTLMLQDFIPMLMNIECLSYANGYVYCFDGMIDRVGILDDLGVMVITFILVFWMM